MSFAPPKGLQKYDNLSGSYNTFTDSGSSKNGSVEVDKFVSSTVKKFVDSIGSRITPEKHFQVELQEKMRSSVGSGITVYSSKEREELDSLDRIKGEVANISNSIDVQSGLKYTIQYLRTSPSKFERNRGI